MVRHARDLPPRQGRGAAEPVSTAVRVCVPEGSQEDEEEAQGLPHTAADPCPRRGVRRRCGELAPGGCRAATLGGGSLVEEVGLEGGGQRQRVDVPQPLLPQGQAHGAAAEIHERHRFGCGRGGERERGLAQSGQVYHQILTKGEHH